MGTENCGWKILFWNCISGGTGSEYQFCVSLEFSTNLSNSLFKIFLAGIEEIVSKSVCSSEIVSFSFFEIVQGVLSEVP